MHDLAWPQAPGGAVLAYTRTEGDPEAALWEAVEALEETGVRVTLVDGLGRHGADEASYRAEDAVKAALNGRLAARPNHRLLEELEAAKAAWLVRAGITVEAGLERTAQMRQWWERFPAGDDGSGQLRAVSGLYGRFMEGAVG
ncbi:hypothetical protein [Streptomyces sp. NPDC058486]|uniref:hypothetical protein n=1 Tax=unclassified Streptomyces TaxID=2593676 RepID=UPI0036510F19